MLVEPTRFPYSIAFRWQHRWLPWCLIEARKTRDPAAALALLNRRHQSRMSTLRNAGVSVESIGRADADDPRMDNATWEFAFQAIVERRRSRMGRVKGQCLPRYQERNRKKEQRHAHQS